MPLDVFKYGRQAEHKKGLYLFNLVINAIALVFVLFLPFFIGINEIDFLAVFMLIFVTAVLVYKLIKNYKCYKNFVPIANGELLENQDIEQQIKVLKKSLVIVSILLALLHIFFFYQFKFMEDVYLPELLVFVYEKYGEKGVLMVVPVFWLLFSALTFYRIRSLRRKDVR